MPVHIQRGFACAHVQACTLWGRACPCAQLHEHNVKAFLLRPCQKRLCLCVAPLRSLLLHNLGNSFVIFSLSGGKRPHLLPSTSKLRLRHTSSYTSAPGLSCLHTVVRFCLKPWRRSRLKSSLHFSFCYAPKNEVKFVTDFPLAPLTNDCFTVLTRTQLPAESTQRRCLNSHLTNHSAFFFLLPQLSGMEIRYQITLFSPFFLFVCFKHCLAWQPAASLTLRLHFF